MAQSSAQREPSMEEILASIRRIIEDSDTGRKPEDGVADAEEPVDGFSVVDVEAFRSELRAGNDPLPPRSNPSDAWPPRGSAVPQNQPESAAAANGSKPFSMADIEADLASSRPDSYAAATIAPIETPVEASRADSSPATSAAKPAGPAASTSQARPAPEHYDDEDAELDRAISAAMDKATVAGDAGQESNWPDPRDEAVASKPDPAAAASRGPIISQETGRQVAAAFGELSEAFAASRRKSFDELAEEMMRPMLQDWLDNNLPTLVEKLVREEIERIARGAQ